MDFFKDPDTDMEGKPPLEQAQMAIAAVLKATMNNPYLAYYVGPGTNSWQKLTQAAAVLWEKPLEEVRMRFVNRQSCNPFDDARKEGE